MPQLTTSDVASINATTATSGGTITSDGGEAIAFSGICWSKTNPAPTTSDDTTKSNVASGSFTAELKNLTPSTKYYVRAYATNRIGTGYGQVKEFVSGNGAPVATAVTISGLAKGDELLTGNYTYTDVESDVEAGSTFQWYVADNATGAGEAAISGGTNKTFRIPAALEGKYIRFGVTPKASTGNNNGIEVKSPFIGAIGEATTVTFMYNGAEVTYGILLSVTTGRKWLDRNLGASRLAQADNDYQAYGDLFQWGRLADGHQSLIRTGTTDLDVAFVNGSTSASPPYETSSTDVPPTNKFIICDGTFGASGDWRTTPNNNLWQGVSGINNPCPIGWRIPTKAEIEAEGITNRASAFSKLKLTRTGMRVYNTGAIDVPNFGQYWTSTKKDFSTGPLSEAFSIGNTFFQVDGSYRGYGMACRCIKD